MRLIAWVGLLIAACSGQFCQYTASDGTTFYDLSGLEATFHHPDTGSTHYYLSFCVDLDGSASCASGDSTSCVTKTGSGSYVAVLGDLATQTFSDGVDGPKTGVTVYYGAQTALGSGNQPCATGDYPQTIVHLICDPAQMAINPTLTKDASTCTFTFTIYTYQACPQTCTFTATDGSYYDFSPLRGLAGSFTGNFFASVCGSTTSCNGGGGGVGVCQSTTDGGASGGVIVSGGAGGAPLVFNYIDGESCGGGTRTSTVTLSCNAGTNTIALTSATASPSCTYTIQGNSKYACSTSASPSETPSTTPSVSLSPAASPVPVSTCTFAPANGKFYDLAGATAPSTAPYVTTVSTKDYWINICGTIDPTAVSTASGVPCVANSAVCKVDSGVSYGINNPSFSPYPTPATDGVSIIYSMGGTCAGGGQLRTVLNIRCDSTKTNPTQFTATTPTSSGCTTTFWMSSPSACLVSGPFPSHFGAGSSQILWNLNPLRSINAPYTVTDFDGTNTITLKLNVLGPVGAVDTTTCGFNAAVCVIADDTTGNTGNVGHPAGEDNHATLTYDSTLGGVGGFTIQYEQPDSYGPDDESGNPCSASGAGGGTSTQLLILCDATVPTIDFQGISEPAQCHYIISSRSQYACPLTTPSLSSSRTASTTNTLTASRTASSTNTATASKTASTTTTATASKTASTTSTATASKTASTTQTATASKTASTTQTATASKTASTTNTATASKTASTTNTATASKTASTTHTATATKTASTTNTATASPSFTQTPSRSQPASASQTPTNSPSLAFAGFVAGDLVVTGTSQSFTVSIPTTVGGTNFGSQSGGTMHVDSTVHANQIVVGAGSTLSISSTVSGTTVTIDGNYELFVDSSTPAVISVTGHATITGNLILNVAPDFTFAPGTQVVVITFGGGSTGNFASVTVVSAGSNNGAAVSRRNVQTNSASVSCGATQCVATGNGATPAPGQCTDYACQVGVGVGVGVGGFLLILLIVLLVLCCCRPGAKQPAPAPAAVVKAPAPVSSTTSSSTDDYYYYSDYPTYSYSEEGYSQGPEYSGTYATGTYASGADDYYTGDDSEYSGL